MRAFFKNWIWKSENAKIDRSFLSIYECAFLANLLRILTELGDDAGSTVCFYYWKVASLSKFTIFVGVEEKSK